MEYTSNLRPYVSRPGYLAEITLVLLHIRDTHASGRLSIRNAERLGLAHLYFNQARLGHITGDKGNGESMLKDLLTWTKGSVRFDPAVVVNNETINWQQAQLFTRWLAFLEICGITHGIPRDRLDGLVESLTEQLPKEPVITSTELEQQKEHAEVRLPQWQFLNDRVHHLIERSLAEEQRQQLRQVFQRPNGIVHHASEVTQDLAKRAARATQEGLLKAAELTQEAARQSALRAEEIMRQAFNQDRRQKLFESVQRTVESVRQAVETEQEPPLPTTDGLGEE